MEIILGNPWYIAAILAIPVLMIGLAKALKRFNEKIAEKGTQQKEVEG